MMFDIMTTLVTGASGHIGVNLVQALLARGRRMRVLVHDHPFPLKELDIEVVKGNICDPDSLLPAFRDVDVVYHLAGRISIADDKWPVLEAINVAGTRNVVDACLKSGVRRLVHFSSIHAIRQIPLDSPVDESRALVATSSGAVYDRSKAAGEAEIVSGIRQGLNAIVVNPTAIIGPGDYQLSHLGEAIVAMACGRLPALVPGGFDWVDVRDVVEGAIKAEEIAPAGARYLLSGHWVSVCDLAKMISEFTGVPPPGFVCPMWLAAAGAPLATVIARSLKKRPLYTAESLRALRSNRHISHAKATRELGYQPRPFKETIEDTLQWYREQGKLKTLNKTE